MPTGAAGRRTASAGSPPWLRFADAEAAQDVHGVLLDTHPLFCDPQGRCPIFVDGMPTRPDYVHVCPPDARRIAPALAELLAERDAL